MVSLNEQEPQEMAIGLWNKLYFSMAKPVGQNNSRSAKNINLMLRYLEKAEDYGLFCSTCPASGKHRSGPSGMRRWNRLYKTISRSYTRISAGLTRYITWEAADRLSNTRNHIESLICIKGEDTHIADFPFWEKQYRYPYFLVPLSGTESSGPYCRQVYPSALRIRRTGKAISGASGWDRPLSPSNFHVSTDYLLLGRELDRDSVCASLLELSAQMTELASKL